MMFGFAGIFRSISKYARFVELAGMLGDWVEQDCRYPFFVFFHLDIPDFEQGLVWITLRYKLKYIFI